MASPASIIFSVNLQIHTQTRIRANLFLLETTLFDEDFLDNFPDFTGVS